MVRQGKPPPLLDRHIRVDREVYAELLRRITELQARNENRRIPVNEVLRALLFAETDRLAK